MGFLSGRVSFIRFRVDKAAPKLFGPQQLERLADHAIGRSRTARKDGVDVGWIAGDDILDTGFDLAKNIVNDTLHCAIRIDTQKLPADLLRAYTRIELQALTADNPSGHPSFRQKREARDAARAKLEEEAKDGRYLRRRAYPVLWDRLTNCLLAGTSSANVLNHLLTLFQETFGSTLTLWDAGQLAAHDQKSGVLRELQPAPFQPGTATGAVAWVGDPASGNYLGNEFLLWLWFVLDTEEDTISLADGSEATVMLARSLMLECPRAVSGSESIRSDAPGRLPEARRAIQAGKLPRKMGLTLVRHQEPFELTLQAETLAVGAAKLPPSEDGDDRAQLDERIDRLRELIATIDLLYGAFLERRLGSEWSKELEKMQRWLQRDDRGRRQAVG